MGVDVLWLVRQEHSRTQVVAYHVMACLQNACLSVDMGAYKYTRTKIGFFPGNRIILGSAFHVSTPLAWRKSQPNCEC